MEPAKRPSQLFKDKRNINPSIDRSTEATAEDFKEAGAILDDHANKLDQISGAGTSTSFYGFWGSIDILAAAHPNVEENSFAVIDTGTRTPVIAKFEGGWKSTFTKAPFIWCNTILDRPQVGQPGVWYIIKDSALAYLFHEGQWIAPGGGSTANITKQTIYNILEYIPADEAVVENHETRIGEIEGLGLFADHANQNILIKNASGDLISELSVAFLNNEGTTFFYNETTEKLELKNDEGTVLSEVPVSAFVSNLASTISLGGNKLDLKDTAGNILASVNFGISNIEGLQAALDGKANDSEVVKGIRKADGTLIQPNAQREITLPEFTQNDIVLWGIDEWGVVDPGPDPEPPTGDVIILDPTTGFEGWTIDRNSEASYVYANGVIQTALANEPRIDHRTGSAKILVEGEATNTIKYSSAFNNYYATTEITPDYGVDPEGLNKATRYQNLGGSNRYIRFNGSVEAGKTYIFSLWVKKLGETANIIISPSWESYLDWIDFSEQINTESWVRIEKTFVAPETSTYNDIRLRSDVVADVLIWGAQLEEGSKATSYIPTNGQIKTRLADNIYRPVPEGKTRSVVTFHDGTTQLFENLSGNFTLPIGIISKVEFQD